MKELEFNRVGHPEGGTRKGPKHSNVQYFSGTEEERVDTLVRETIQNPLDHPFDKSKPVNVEFEEMQIPTREIPSVDKIRKTLEALIIELKKLKETEGGQIDKYLMHYEAAKKRLSKENILTLRISDYNAKGLTGSKKENKSVLGRFLGGTGYFDDGSTGGGSGGLGKFAPFGFSAVNFCFYSSLNLLDEYIYYGWGDNFYYEIDDESYMGETNLGWKGDVLKLKHPYEEGFLSKRRKMGTDVFVIGFQEKFNSSWIKLMTLSVIRNFFASILDGKLTVKLKNISGTETLLDADSVESHLHLFEKNQYRKKFKTIPADGHIIESIRAYKSGRVFNSLDTELTPLLGKCEIRILRDDDFSKYFSFMRGPRMFIYGDKQKYGDLPYAGVFCCISKEGNILLRNIEDSHHRNWPFESKGQDREILREIQAFLKYCIDEVASHDSKDTFSLSGLNIFSLGDTQESENGSEASSETDKETAVIYPKTPFSNNTPSNLKYGGVVVVDKRGHRKKIEPKKEPKSAKKKSGAKKSTSNKKREYRVTDFNASIFKNDAVDNEYHLFIDSDKQAEIKNILFTIPGAEGISFIDSIYDQEGKRIERDLNSKESDNAFERFKLKEGLNKFKVHAKFNRKVQILIK